MISLRFASVVFNNNINERGLYNIFTMELSFSTTDGSGSATVVSQPLSFSAQQRLISSTVVEFEGRPSSKPAHAQMTPNVITVAEPSVVENENSLITQLNWSPLFIQSCNSRIHSLMQQPYITESGRDLVFRSRSYNKEFEFRCDVFTKHLINYTRLHNRWHCVSGHLEICYLKEKVWS